MSGVFSLFCDNFVSLQGNNTGMPRYRARVGSRGPVGYKKLGRKVRQTLPTLLFVDPAGGKEKKMSPAASVTYVVSDTLLKL